MRCEITSGLSKSCSKSARGVQGQNLSLVLPSALYLQSSTATVADRVTLCSYAQGLTGRMAAGTSVASEMGTNGALRSARQKQQSAINSTTIFSSNCTPPPMSWDICVTSIFQHAPSSPCQFGSANSTTTLYHLATIDFQHHMIIIPSLL